MKKLITVWLRWRYGAGRTALKPPVGYHPVYAPRPFLWAVAYRLRLAWWSVENLLFKHTGPVT